MSQRHLRQTTDVFYEGNHSSKEICPSGGINFFLYWVNHLESPLKFTFLHSCTKNSIFVLIKDNRVFSCSFQPNKTQFSDHHVSVVCPSVSKLFFDYIFDFIFSKKVYQYHSNWFRIYSNEHDGQRLPQSALNIPKLTQSNFK